jgi:hypothetical protein
LIPLIKTRRYLELSRKTCANVVLLLAISCSFCVSAERIRAREVWISNRGDEKSGTGAIDDPFNGSTPAWLDRQLEAIPPQTSIHLGTGTFITRGIQAKNGWRITGAGKDATIIKLADEQLTDATPGRERCVIYEFDFQGFFQYFELSDLTIDCNRQNQPAFTRNLRGYTLDAWIIASKSAKIRNVRSLGTWANPGEGFPCHVYHDGSKGNQDRIEVSGCENINPIGYLTAISVFDQMGGTVGGSIHDCTVTDHLKGAAFGAGGWRHFNVHHNVTRNVAIPIVIDTHNYYDVDIFANRFYHCGDWGILFNGSGVYQNINIHNNIFEMADGAQAPCLNTGRARVTARVYRNTFIQKNRALPYFWKGPNTKADLKQNVVRSRKKDSR